jgi:hypothetical protein
MNISGTSAAQVLYTQATAPDSQANPQLAIKVLKDELETQKEQTEQLVKSVAFYDNSGQEVTGTSNRVDLRV